MITYWIVKDHLGLRIAEGDPRWMHDSEVGPFWSYHEAMAMMHFWTK